MTNELKKKPEIRYNPFKNKELSLNKNEENKLKLYPTFRPMTYSDFLVCLGLSHVIVTSFSRLSHPL
jgi:hypothetical protein